MTLSLFLYGVTLGAFLMAGGHFLDGALRAMGRPTRWVWGVVLGVVALTPILALLSPSEPGRTSGGVMAVPLEALYGLAPGGVAFQPASDGLLGVLNSPDRGLLLLWLAASALALVVFLGSAARLRKAASTWPHHRVEDRELLVSPDLGPALLGFFRPRIVLPAWALELEEEALEMVLLHEEEHLRARDPLLLGVGILLLATAPWNPALWWGLRRLRLAVEADCDARVLGRGVRRARYGALLVHVASGARGTFSLAPSLAEGGGAFLERRLRMMGHHVGKKKILGAGAGLMTAGFFLFLACETPTPPTADNPANPEVDAALTPNGGKFSFQEIAESATKDSEGEVILKKVPPQTVESGGGEAKFQFRTQAAEGKVAVEIQEGSLVRLRPISEDGSPPLIYVDGVLQEAGTAVIRQLDPDAIERIEVIKGKAAEGVFGKEAAGGVIQVFLKK